MKKFLGVLIVIAVVATGSYAQGPPITADKPIMIGSKTFIAKTLTEYRRAGHGDFLYAPLMLHYVINPDLLVAVHTPLVRFQHNHETIGNDSGWELGDIKLLTKHQFYRRDQRSKTFRMVIKSLQTFPTGAKLFEQDFSNGQWQSYFAWVFGYETLKYGISHELGYNIVYGSKDDEIRHKIGFGLPLLKPVYPVNQINLYFEYEQKYLPASNGYSVFYAQGLQYAKGRVTVEAAVQVPLYQNDDIPFFHQRRYSLLFGSRFIL